MICVVCPHSGISVFQQMFNSSAYLVGGLACDVATLADDPRHCLFKSGLLDQTNC